MMLMAVEIHNIIKGVNGEKLEKYSVSNRVITALRQA